MSFEKTIFDSSIEFVPKVFLKWLSTALVASLMTISHLILDKPAPAEEDSSDEEPLAKKTRKEPPTVSKIQYFES